MTAKIKGMVMMTTEYRYYVDVSLSEAKERPTGIYRAPADNRLYIEAIHSDGEWHFSPDLVRAFTSGDTLNIEEIDKATAEKAIKYIKRVLEERNKKNQT
jgi:hypothetical protein